MKQFLKKFLSLSLSIAMLLSLAYIPASAETISEGTNGTTIYVSFAHTSDAKGNNVVTELDAGATFFTHIKFSGNPTDLDDSVTGYNFLIGYDSEKMTVNSKTNADTSPTFNGSYAEDVIYAGWGSLDGIYGEDEDTGDTYIKSSGTFLKIKFTANEALTQQDLNSIKLINLEGDERSKILGTNKAEFAVVQVPDIIGIELTTDDYEIYSDVTADEVKALITSVTFMDASGNETEYTSADAEWSNLSVTLPDTLVVGENTATAIFNGYACEFDFVVSDRLDSIAITTAPTKTTYTAFETFDKTGMVVTATFESGNTEDVTADCDVDTTTELKVADRSWTVTYNGKTATQAITVNPKQIEKPAASGNYTYTGLTQNFTYATAPDAKYVTVTGDVQGKDADTYTATATLKDKANTVWKGSNNTADVTLNWTIGKTTITEAFSLEAMKYTTKYSQLPTTKTVKGVNGENVEATITWFLDEDYTRAATGTEQIAASYTGNDQTVNLYYKANGMANYEEFEGLVVVSVTDKDAATITWSNLPSGLTLSGKTASGTYATAGYDVNANMFTVKDKIGATLSGSKTVTITKGGATVAKITDAGSYTVTVSYEDTDNKGSETFTVTINPKSIAGSAVSIKNGAGSAVATSAQAPATFEYAGANITPEVTGVAGISASDYDVTTNTAQKNVSDSVYTVTITGKGNYTGTATGYWKITPATINLSSATVASKQFNGLTNDANVTAATFTGLKGTDALVLGTDYEVTSAVYASADASNNASVTASVALKNTAAAKNYTLATNSVVASAVITKAAAPSLSASGTQTLLSSSVTSETKDYSFNLASIITGIPANAGAATYAVKTEGTYAKKIGSGIDGSNLKLNVATPQAAGAADSIVVTVSTANYADVDVTINFEFKNKTTVTVTMADKSVTYGETYSMAGAYTNQPASGYSWTYSYVGIDGTDYAASEIAPTQAGKYSVTASYEDNTPDSENPAIPGHVGSVIATLTINKKTVTVTAGDVAITKVYDGTTDAGALTGVLALTGKVGEDDVYVDMSSKVVGAYADSAVGTYTVAISGLALGGADKDNYVLDSSTFNFANAKITKQLQSALTINGAAENIETAMFSDLAITVAGGNGTGAYALTSSDATVATLTAGDSGVWTVNLLKPGTTTLTATKAGDNNYEAAESVAITLTVTPKTIAEGDFVFDLADKVFTKTFINPAVTAEGMTADVDYTVVYENNVNVGVATITVTGKGNYTGEVVKTFNIIKKTITDAEFVINIAADSYEFTGSAIEPAISVLWAENGALTVDADYTVTYTDNLNVGTATITVTGAGNYDGTMTKTFTITPTEYIGTVVITADAATIAEGTVLTAVAPAGGALTYQWMKNGEEITENGTGSTYTVTAGDVDAAISVVVTSTGNYVGSLTSAEVLVGKTVLTATVTIAGDSELTLTVEGAPAEENYTIVWLRDGEAISGATGTSYTVAYDDLGRDITAKLVAAGDTYTGEVLSGNVISVPALAPSFEGAPTAEVGNGMANISFTAKANGSEIINYQILVDDVVIDTIAGTETTYTLTGLANGTIYSVKVIATNGVGSTTSEAVSVTPRRANAGGGGGAVKNTVNVPATNITGGSVKINSQMATPGKKVTVTVTPDAGYELKELVVIDKKGNKLEVTKNGDVYEFVMPNGAVTVNAEFVQSEEEPSVEPVTGFVDVDKAAYYKNAVDWAVEAGITKGTGENTFSPETECTRAEMVTFLWRAAGMPKVSAADNQFADVADDSYYKDAVAWAVANGITAGVGDGKFAPDAIVDRAQTVTFLWRLAQSPANGADSTFGDVDADAYYGDAVAWAIENAITNGISNDAFGPADSCTRAQIVTFLFRYFAE